MVGSKSVYNFQNSIKFTSIRFIFIFTDILKIFFFFKKSENFIKIFEKVKIEIRGSLNIGVEKINQYQNNRNTHLTIINVLICFILEHTILHMMFLRNNYQLADLTKFYIFILVKSEIKFKNI